jgi:hypothetical protein
VIVRRPAKNELSIHYMLLRQLVGEIGTLLPIVLIVGNTISSTTQARDWVTATH